MKSDINQLKAGVVLNYIIIGLNALVGLLYTPYMLRMLGQSEYGLYSLVASVISYLTILDLGFGNAIVRYTAKLRTEGKVKEQYEMLGMFFVLYLVIGLIAFVAGLFLYFNVESIFGKTMTELEIERTKMMMLLLTGNLAVTFPMSIFGSIITAYEKFVFPRILNIVRVVLNTAVMIVLLHLGYKAIAMVVVQTVFNILTLLLNYIYCKYRIQIHLLFSKFNWSLLSEIAIYSLWIFIAAIVDRIYLSTGQFVLGAVVGTIEVSVFAVAMTLNGMYTQFSTAMSSVFLPKVTSMVTLSKSDNEISDLFIKTGRVQYIVMSFILSGYIVFGRDFMALWAGEGYKNAYYICLLLFIPGTIPLCQNMGISIMQARNQMKFRSLCYLVIAIGSLFLQIILAKPYGGIGCAMAISVSTVLGHIIAMNMYYYKVQRINIPLFWKEIIRMSLIPVIMCGISLFILIHFNISLNWRSMLIGIFIYSIVYIPLVYLIQFNQYERDLFSGIIRKINVVKK